MWNRNGKKIFLSYAFLSLEISILFEIAIQMIFYGFLESRIESRKTRGERFEIKARLGIKRLCLRVILSVIKCTIQR